MKTIVVLAWVLLTLVFYLMFKFMGNAPIEAKIVAGIVVANIIIVIGAIGSGCKRR